MSVFGVILVRIFPHLHWIRNGEIRSISPYTVRMQENTDQNNCKSISPYSVQMQENTNQNNSERISPYAVWIRENTDQINSEYGHFSHSDHYGNMLFFYSPWKQKTRGFLMFSRDIERHISIFSPYASLYCIDQILYS